jgi:GWxTD domain-containing protein
LTCCAAADRARRLPRGLAALPALPALLALTACALVGCASAGPQPGSPRALVELTNPALGPDYTSWLVGAVSRLATPEEIASYLALTDDRAAEEFIRAFWERRDPSPDRPDNAVQDAFERRSAEADRQFTEAGIPGRRTARGEVWVLYGRPTGHDYQVSPREGGPPIELWVYDKNAPAGLDGRRPASYYRFIKRGDLTVIYVPGLPEDRLPARPRPPRDDGRK